MNRISTRKRESYLQVRQPTKGSLSKGWKKKYVIIRQNKGSDGKSVLLELYIEKNAHHKPVISMLLAKVDFVTRIPSKTKEYAFEIKSGEKNLLCVACESEIETLEWMEIFSQHLLEPKKELAKLPDIEDDFCKVSIIPNKDSEHLALEGDYYAVVKEMKVRLHDPYTGQMKIEWDMHHLKKVLVSSKCHFRDKERIMHYVVSKRSEHGKAELHFFSLQARRLADAIFGVLNGNIHVRSRQTRSASMVFEITSKDLKRMMKDKDPDTQSLASVAMETHMEEERSVQTIPEEMGPSEEKEISKETGDEDGSVGMKGENGHEEQTVNGHEDQKEQSPVQSNGHVAENGVERENNGDVKETELQDTKKEGVVQDAKEESEEKDSKEDESVQNGKQNESTTDTNTGTSKEDITSDGNEETTQQDANNEADQNGVENVEISANVETAGVENNDNKVPDDKVEESDPSDGAPVTNGDIPPAVEDEKALVEESQEQHPVSNGLEKDEDVKDAESQETNHEVSPSVDKPDESDNVQEHNGSPAEGEDPVNDSAKVNENQTLPHDTSTDSGFINDAGDQNGTTVSINTNNNNSRESLNCTVDANDSNVSTDGDTSKNSERMQPDILPVVGMPVDVADLEDISVIVYSEDSPEVLV